MSSRLVGCLDLRNSAFLLCPLCMLLASLGYAAEQARYWPNEPEPLFVATKCFAKGVIVMELEVGGEDSLLTIDSGAGTTLLDFRFREKFRKSGQKEVFRGSFNDAGNKEVPYDVYAAPILKFQGTVLEAPETVRCSASRGGRLEHDGRPIEGHLGMDVLQLYRVLVDYDTRTVKFWKGTDERWSAPEWPSVPLEVWRRQSGGTVFSIRGTVGTGAELSLVVDTAAGVEAALSQNVYSLLRATDNIVDLGHSAYLAHGGPVSAEFGKLDRWRIGEFAHRALVVYTAKECLVGCGYLWQYTCVFDFPGRRLYLRPASRFGRGNCADWEGLQLPEFSVSGALLTTGSKVLDVKAGSPAERVGFKKGDVIRDIGDVELRASPLSALYDCVLWQDDDQIKVHVKRDAEDIYLQLPVERGLAESVE